MITANKVEFWLWIIQNYSNKFTPHNSRIQGVTIYKHNYVLYVCVCILNMRMMGVFEAIDLYVTWHLGQNMPRWACMGNAWFMCCCLLEAYNFFVGILFHIMITIIFVNFTVYSCMDWLFGYCLNILLFNMLHCY